MESRLKKVLISGKYWYLAVATVFVLSFASASFADTTPMTLTGVGDGFVFGNVYVDPYTATVGSATNVPVICDDWSDNSYENESWTADTINEATVGNPADGTPKFGNNAGLYNELVWLGTQLLENPTNTTNQTELSFAIWDLSYGANGTAEETPAPLAYMCSTLGGTYGGGACSGLSGSNLTEWNATMSLISQAGGESGYVASGTWDILTPNTSYPITCNGGSCASTPPQEFLYHVPEPSTFALLAIGMIALLGLTTWKKGRALHEV